VNGFNGRAGHRNSDKSKETASLCVVYVVFDRGDSLYQARTTLRCHF